MGEATLLEKILTAVGAGFLAIGTWAWNHTHKRIDHTEDKVSDMSEQFIAREEFARHEAYEREQFAALRAEQDIQRAHVAKIFDKLEQVRNDMHAQERTLVSAITDAINRTMPPRG